MTKYCKTKIRKIKLLNWRYGQYDMGLALNNFTRTKFYFVTIDLVICDLWFDDYVYWWYLPQHEKSDTHQSMKTSDNDLKVNLNLYPDAVNVLGCV